MYIGLRIFNEGARPLLPVSLVPEHGSLILGGGRTFGQSISRADSSQKFTERLTNQ
jgi:hypothetical protein